MYHLFNLLYHITCGNVVYLSIIFFDDKGNQSKWINPWHISEYANFFVLF